MEILLEYFSRTRVFFSFPHQPAPFTGGYDTLSSPRLASLLCAENPSPASPSPSLLLPILSRPYTHMFFSQLGSEAQQHKQCQPLPSSPFPPPQADTILLISIVRSQSQPSLPLARMISPYAMDLRLNHHSHTHASSEVGVER